MACWRRYAAMLLVVDFEVSKAYTRPSLSLFAFCLQRGCKFSTTAPGPCLPATTLPTMMAMDSPSENWKQVLQVQVALAMKCFISAIEQ